MHTIMRRAACLALLALPLAVAAQRPVAYPAKGQSATKQNKDEGECNKWAIKSSGVDPAVLAANPPPQETGSTLGGGERARGAARGAVGGAVIGGIAGDAGTGAGVGAAVGTVRGGRQARANQAARNQQAQQSHSAQLDSFNRAYAACMSGRGYSVS